MNAGLKMSGKRVLVTGPGTGLGREIALEFARQSADSGTISLMSLISDFRVKSTATLGVGYVPGV